MCGINYTEIIWQMIKCECRRNRPFSFSCGWTKIDNWIQSSSGWLWITNVMEFIWCLITIFRLISCDKRILVDKCFDCLIYLPVFDHISGERRNQNVATSKFRHGTRSGLFVISGGCSPFDHMHHRIRHALNGIAFRYSDYGAKYVFDLILTIKCSRSIARIYNFQNIMDCVRQNKFCCIHKSLCGSREREREKNPKWKYLSWFRAVHHIVQRLNATYAQGKLNEKKQQQQTERRRPCRKWWINVNEFANVRNTVHSAVHATPATMLSFTKHWISIFAFDLFIL